MHASERYEDLLQPIFRQGVLVYSLPALAEIRARTLEQLSHIAGAVLRFDNPQTYFVGLESQLYDLKSRMVLEAKQAGTSEVFGGEV